MGNQTDISVIVTAHHEGRLIHRTLRSLFRSAGYARDHNISTEVIVVMDRPDDATETYFLNSTFEGSIHVYRTDHGDPGLSRNLGVAKASGKYVAFLDGDDLMGRTWLRAAYEEAERRGADAVYHPEYVVLFEGDNVIAKPVSSTSERFKPANLFEYNYWLACLFAPRALALRIPFAATPLEQGFGYEDWHWCCEMIAEKIPVLIVPESVFFCRRKIANSRLAVHDQRRVLIPPTRLFEPARFSEILRER